jgi:hypothetical protein
MSTACCRTERRGKFTRSRSIPIRRHAVVRRSSTPPDLPQAQHRRQPAIGTLRRRAAVRPPTPFPHRFQSGEPRPRPSGDFAPNRSATQAATRVFRVSGIPMRGIASRSPRVGTEYYPRRLAPHPAVTLRTQPVCIDCIRAVVFSHRWIQCRSGPNTGC